MLSSVELLGIPSRGVKSLSSDKDRLARCNYCHFSMIFPNHHRVTEVKKEKALQVYDAAIGDITIRYSRISYVDFTLPYTESGVAMIVPVKDDRDKNTWVFLKPLTTDLWFGSIAFFIYTAIVIWLLERRINNAELTGSFFRQLGIAIYFSFFADSK